MGKIFKNTDNNKYQQEAAQSLNGWDATIAYGNERISRITDTVGAGIALAKMGTSIPTPFARMQIFNTAFAQVNNLGHDSDSVYGKLVSECLDFLEFIFNYGDQIQVKKWNIQQEILNLKNSTSKKHNALAECIDKFARDLQVTDIYLFYYNNVLIGGSSPYTLVYTSPNWQRIKPITNASGLGGNQLFPDYANPNVQPKPLYVRHESFRTFLTRYIVAFRGISRFQETPFRQYIYMNQRDDDPDMQALFGNITGAQPYGTIDFLRDYDVLKAGADVDILGLGGNDVLYLAYQKQGPGTVSVVSDDYEIVCTHQRFRQHYAGVDTPLVLSDYGIPSALYIGGIPWQPGTILVRNPNVPLGQRVLPGGGNVGYPYLTDADFLEDKLLKMSYPINETAFLTLSGTQYLLPLKKTFFEYFDIKDINQIQNLSLSAIEDGSDVTVTLRIPIKCKTHPYIELERKYSKSNGEIVDVPSVPGFSLAIFPSYKLQDTSVPNLYSILLHDSSEHGQLKASFFALENNLVQVDEKDTVVRTPKASIYKTVERSFDLIEVSWGGATALILPKFKEVNPSASTSGLAVGIDFGTTNSYVCWSDRSGADANTLEISKRDCQVLMLNRVDLSNGNYGSRYQDSFMGMFAFNQAIDREFAPLLLGPESDVQFPCRTVTCESKNFAGKNEPMLFGDIDLGFNFMKEVIELKDVVYNPNIKWDLEQGSGKNLTDSQNRIKAFCEQVAWMLKNKIMLSDHPATRFSAYLTFPYTMALKRRNIIKGFWIDAFAKVMGTGNVKVEDVYEAIAPYYYMIGHGAKFSKNALNIDIGGGTTDMLFADVENEKLFYNSSLFAANDIWGDGKQKVEGTRMDNGFVRYFEQLLEGNHLSVEPDRKDAYTKYKLLVKSSSDLMSYIFRYDKKFNFISYIRENKNLMPILFVHLGAILYHVTQVLKDKGMKMPSTITFSGMGAQYIHMMSTEESDITALIKTLLAHFMGYGINDPENMMPGDFKVTFQNSPKEVTAQGAMLENNPSLEDIKGYDRKEFYVYGFDNEPPLVTYKKAKKYQDDVIKEFNKFIEKFLKDGQITKYLKKNFEVEFSNKLIDTLVYDAEMGFALMASSKDGNDDVEETLFFWPLKNGLYEASKIGV